MTGRVEIAARLNEVLRRSVEADEVPGVVAMVANDRDSSDPDVCLSDAGLA